MLVDDEAYLTQIVSYNLQKEGASVLVRRNGAEMCEAAEKHQPDLIIADYQMPVMDGFSACVSLKANPATNHIPVIMLTARGHRLTPAELERTNICCVFAKPFSAKQLLARVEEVFKSRPQNGIAAVADGHKQAIVK